MKWREVLEWSWRLAVLACLVVIAVKVSVIFLDDNGAVWTHAHNQP